MNQNCNNIYARLSSKLATFIALSLLVLLVGCGKTSAPKAPESTAKVVQTIDRIVLKEPKDPNVVIRRISANGDIEIGNRGSTVMIHNFLGLENKPFKLEEKGSVGDRFEYVFHIEDQLLENGKVQSVVKSIGVRSKNQQKYEEYFSASKDGENRPRIQPQ
jgi:hypothetical protein